MVLKGVVSTTEQMAVESQGDNSRQGFLQLSSRQARPEGQSESTWHTGSTTGCGCGGAAHDTSGLPTVPEGHVHEATWLTTLQTAVGAHGFETWHGFTHLSWMHAWSVL